MTYLNIIEKLKVLIDMLLDFKVVLIFTILLIITSIFYIIKKINSKKYILISLLLLVIMFGISIISNYEILSKTFDNFTTIFFTNIYFPSIYVYIVVLVIGLISFITSMLNITLGKIYKTINTIMFIVNNILLVIILNIVAKNKIDIFSISSLYTNTNLVVILEISMSVFILWILSLIIVYTTNTICIRLTSKKVNKKVQPIVDTTIEIEAPSLEEIPSYAIPQNDLSIALIEENSQNIIIEPIEITEDNIEPEVIYEMQDSLIELSTEEIQDEIEIIEDNTIEIIESVEDKEDTFENKELIEVSIIESEENNLIEETIEEVIELEPEYENSIVVNVTPDTIVVNPEENDRVTFEDILNGNVPVDYYEKDSVLNTVSYNIVDPQILYEEKYQTIKETLYKETKFQDMVQEIEEVPQIEEIQLIDEEILIEEPITNINIEDITKEEKKKIVEERLIENTVSLKDLVKEPEIVIEDSNEVLEEIKISKTIESEINNKKYTVDDYKQFIKMLNSLKNHTQTSNVNVYDAITISLINNYSIDDCIKFKEILKNSLN